MNTFVNASVAASALNSPLNAQELATPVLNTLVYGQETKAVYTVYRAVNHGEDTTRKRTKEARKKTTRRVVFPHTDMHAQDAVCRFRATGSGAEANLSTRSDGNV